MNTTMRQLVAPIALLAGLCAAGAASAQSTWNLTASTCTPTNTTSYGQGSCTVDGVKATVSAWAAGGTGVKFASAMFSEWSGGLGIVSSSENGSSPNHAIDNSGNIELVAVNFSTETMLSALSIGWWQTDADVSVLRWTGTGAPDLKAQTPSGLTSSGWQLVASSDADPSGSVRFNGGGYSSWWLISSYFGGLANASDGSGLLNRGDDYFKLLSFSGTSASTPPAGVVPEPGSLALAGLAIAGIVGAQRRRARRG